MIKKYFVLILCSFCLSQFSLGLSVPQGVWKAEYDAATGILPSGSSPAWINYYKPGKAVIVGSENNNNKVLRLNNEGFGGFDNQLFVLKSPRPATIFISKKMTIEYRFRLVDTNSTYPQVTFSLTCPTSKSGTNFRYLFRFTKDGFVYDTDHGYPKYRHVIGTTWHTMRLVVDTTRDMADMYIDDRLTLAGIRGVPDKRECGIKLGDGSGWVHGIVDISAVRWSDKITDPAITSSSVQPPSLKNIRQQRYKLAHRKRRIIMNSDNGDMVESGLMRAVFTPNSLLTEDEFLDSRYSDLTNSQVDAIFYNWTPMGEILNLGDFTWLDAKKSFDIYSKSINKGDLRVNWKAIREITRLWNKALDILIRFGHENNKEIFCTVRMNDTHDSTDSKLLNQWKIDHPGCLMGRKGDKIPYGGHRWSAVNYEKEAVRSKMYQIFKEICAEHDVDGIEMDFYRHPIYFKTAAFGKPVTDEQRAIMTGFMQRIRKMTEEVSVGRNRPLLIAVRVPDSVEYCKGIGLDVEKWMQKGLIDVMTVGGYHHFRPWKESVKFAGKYNVPLYACLSASLLGYNINDWRSEAKLAWKSGVDGIYIFNIFNPHARQFRELGSIKTINGGKVNYKSTWRGWYTAKDKGYWLKEGHKYAWIVRFDSHPEIFAKPFMLAMEFPLKTAEIHYTLDGSKPTKSSPLYKYPVKIDKSVTVRTVAFNAKGIMLSLYDTEAKFLKVAKIYKPESKLPLKIFGFPVGTKKSVAIECDDLGDGDNWVFLSMNDVDRKREVTVFINGNGPLALPDELLNPTGTSSALWKLPSGILHKGKNRFDFTFSDDLNHTTSGFSIENIAIIRK